MTVQRLDIEMSYEELVGWSCFYELENEQKKKAHDQAKKDAKKGGGRGGKSRRGRRR